MAQDGPGGGRDAAASPIGKSKCLFCSRFEEIIRDLVFGNVTGIFMDLPLFIPVFSHPTPVLHSFISCKREQI